MPDPIVTQPVMLLSAEKDLIQGALSAAPESRDKDAILAAISRSGMHDSEVQLTAGQVAYLATNLASFTELPALSGTKYGTPIGQQVAGAIADRLGVGAGS